MGLGQFELSLDANTSRERGVAHGVTESLAIARQKRETLAGFS